MFGPAHLPLLPLMVWSLIAGRLGAADVTLFGMGKGQQFAQSVGSAPVLLASNAFTFQALVLARTNGVVTNATFKISTSPTVERQLTNTGSGTLWRYEDFANTQSQLDATYPTGNTFSRPTYTFTMHTVNDGTRAVVLDFWIQWPLLAISYPPTPQISNLSAAQQIDHTRDFTLQWNSLGGSPLTLVQLTVLDAASNVVFASPTPFSPGALDGTSTSIVIPAFSLPPGAALTGRLTAANTGLPNTNSYPGATGIATLAKDTQFPMTTRPAPPAPRLRLLAVSGSQVQLLATDLETNRLYHLQRSTNLAAWVNVALTNPPVTAVQFNDVPPPGPAKAYYRLRIGQ
ncbi:MAG: hypothetical protein N3I86_11840 [Verrucomicrobiae bacterium]|nr:hypothetical protein [Verrucomicrobiae bacterium]